MREILLQEKYILASNKSIFNNFTESDLSEIYDHSENEGILVEVPNNQKIIIEPGNHKKSKSSLLAALFHKFSSFKNDVHS